MSGTTETLNMKIIILKEEERLMYCQIDTKLKDIEKICLLCWRCDVVLGYGLIKHARDCQINRSVRP